MGHKLSTYHDVRMKRIELLRGIYASADLKIFPKQRTTLEDILKEIIRARGERILPSTLGSRLCLGRLCLWKMIRRRYTRSI